MLDDPEVVYDIIEQQSPHPLTLAMAEFVQTRAAMEAAALRGECPRWAAIDERSRPLIPGVFRTTWADHDVHVPGAGVLLDNPRLIDAAARLFDSEIVRPYFVYVNISTPNPQNEKHCDIPAFRGIERDRHPTWLLNVMAGSGLFERWRVKIATAVAWFYDGEGGGFSYWPNGWDGPAVELDPPVNSCVMGDNDFMPHRVEQIGPDGARTLYPMDAAISLMPDRTWQVAEGDLVHDTFAFDRVRVSVSWKALVFTDAAEAEVYDSHTDDIDTATVMAALRDDLEQRSIAAPATDDPLGDPEFTNVLRATYLPDDLKY